MKTKMKTGTMKLATAMIIGFFIFNTPVFAQNGKYGATPEDSVECVKNLSLYREYYKQKNYKEAIPGWRRIFLNCPASTEYMYLDGITLVKVLMAAEKDKAKQDALIDTLMMVYDQRIKYFNKEGYVLGRKAVDMLTYLPAKTQETYETLQRVYQLQDKKMEAAASDTYFQVALMLLEEGKITKEEALDVYDKVSEVVTHNLKNDPDNKFYLAAQENIETRFEKIADCPSLIALYSPKFQSSPNDVELLKKITKLLDKKDCTGEKLFLDAVVNLDKIEPSAESKSKIAKMYFAKGSYSEAVKFYQQAIEMETDNNTKAQYNYELAQVYQKMGQFPTARNYAQKAISLRSGWGMPYLLIGDLYVSSAKDCGDNDCHQKAVYWIGVDKYQQAKSVDPSVAGDANTKIATYSKYFPAKADCFFHGLNDGDSYTVPCWINESTKVRTQ